jgi:hypothetical protein
MRVRFNAPMPSSAKHYSIVRANAQAVLTNDTCEQETKTRRVFR